MASKALTIKSLGDGQLGNAKATLFTATAKTVITFFQVFNTDTVNRIVQIYVKRGATSRTIFYIAAMGTLTGADVLSARKLTLAAGDLIEGNSDAAAKIDWVLTGVEET